MTKICTSCSKEKDVGEFWKNPKAKDGCRKHCKECESARYREKFNKDYLRSMLKLCLYRAKQENEECDSVEDLYNYLNPIYEIGECEKCGRKLEHGIGKGKQSAKSPSIDRIIPHEGYTVGNVALLCLDCNARKQNNSLEDFKSWVSWLEGGSILIGIESYPHFKIFLAVNPAPIVLNKMKRR